MVVASESDHASQEALDDVMAERWRREEDEHKGVKSELMACRMARASACSPPGWRAARASASVKAGGGGGGGGADIALLVACGVRVVEMDCAKPRTSGILGDGVGGFVSHRMAAWGFRVHGCWASLLGSLA